MSGDLQQTTKKTISMRNIAELAGVSQPVVSAVLNNNYSRIRVSEKTREVVQKVLDEYGYYPNASARALSTRRTGYIGFFLSDAIMDGWANSHYATMMLGIEEECYARGYSLSIGRYNLSNLDSFVFPQRVGERSIDGLLLTGYLEAEIVRHFFKFGIPCVCLGDDLEVAEMLPVVANDFVHNLFLAVEYLVELGHKNIVFANETSCRAKEVAQLLLAKIQNTPKTCHCNLQICDVIGGHADTHAAGPLLADIFDTQRPVRPTAIIASNQLTLALLGGLHKRGLRCPEDISLVSTSDTPMSTMSVPMLTCIDIRQRELGRMATKMLIECLNENKQPDPSMSIADVPGKLVIRESCAAAKSGGR